MTTQAGRTYLRVGLIVLLLGVAMSESAEGVRYAFSQGGPTDYPVVSMEIGRPPREVRLRLMFDAVYYRALVGSLCGGLAHITLFSAQLLRQSTSMVIIETNECGVDIVDFSGARWEAHIAASHNFLQDPHASVDGIWLIGPHDCALPMCGWQYFLNTRHIFRADSEPIGRHLLSASEAGEGCHVKLNLTEDPALRIAVPASLGWRDNVRVFINGAEVSMEDGARLVVTPDAHTTYLPTPLFQRYFSGHNLFRDDPAQWPSLGIQVDDCQVDFATRTILPLSYIYPGREPFRERSAAVVFHNDIWSDTDGELTLGHAVKGYNGLKVHPHRFDNRTIVLGGNVLWGNLGLAIDQVAHTAELITYPHRRELGLLDIVYLLLLALLYVRWLLSGMWLDTCDNHRLYMTMLTNYGILSSVILALVKICAGYPLYYAAVSNFLHGLTSHHNAAAGGLQLLLVVSIVVDCLLIATALIALHEPIGRAIRSFVTSLALLLRGVLGGRAALEGVVKPRFSDDWAAHHHHPYCPERLPDNRGHWDPRTGYARSTRNEPFTWFHPEFVACYTLLVDLVFATGVWLATAASDDVVVADTITLLVFSVTIYTGMLYTLILIDALRPTWRAGQWPNMRSLAVLAGVSAITIAIATLTGRFVVRRVIDDYWTEYHGTALDAVVVLYMLVLLLAAKLMTHHIFTVYVVQIKERTSDAPSKESRPQKRRHK